MRRRIERDLHDGVQQHLVGTRLRLQLASDTVRSQPRQAERMLTAIAGQIDEALDDLRTLARGIYPRLLAQQGLGAALRSASLHLVVPVSVHEHGLRRIPPDEEAAVYFCCLEALQNLAKHAGSRACAGVDLWEESQRLCFEISDTGSGFTPGEHESGAGLVNMRDRIEAVGGRLSIVSAPGRETRISGMVPTP